MTDIERNHILSDVREKARYRKECWLKNKTRYNYKRYGEAIATLVYWESELITKQNKPNDKSQ